MMLSALESIPNVERRAVSVSARPWPSAGQDHDRRPKQRACPGNRDGTMSGCQRIWLTKHLASEPCSPASLPARRGGGLQRDIGPLSGVVPWSPWSRGCIARAGRTYTALGSPPCHRPARAIARLRQRYQPELQIFAPQGLLRLAGRSSRQRWPGPPCTRRRPTTLAGS